MTAGFFDTAPAEFRYHAPPGRFNDHIDLIRYLNTLDFRGSISIDQPTLYTSADGNPVLLQFLTLARVGSTPVRLGHYPGDLNRLLWYSGRVGCVSGDVYTGDHRVVIRLFMRLKLGFMGRAFAAVKTGHWPPWASLMIEYGFDLQRQYPSVQAVFQRDRGSFPAPVLELGATIGVPDRAGDVFGGVRRVYSGRRMPGRVFRKISDVGFPKVSPPSFR